MSAAVEAPQPGRKVSKREKHRRLREAAEAEAEKKAAKKATKKSAKD